MQAATGAFITKSLEVFIWSYLSDSMELVVRGERPHLASMLPAQP